MGGSDDEVMILGSEEEDEVVTLDESSITSLLAGAGVTITRTTGTSSPAPRTSRPVYVKPTTAMAGMQSSKTTAPIGRQSFKTTTPIGRQARLASSGHGGALLSQHVRPAQRQLMATKRKDEEVDPLDLGDGDIEMEYDKMDNLREMLAKSSVAITYQGQRSGPAGKSDRAVEKEPRKEMMRSMSTPKLPSKMAPKPLKGSPQLQRSLSGELLRSDPKSSLNLSSAKTTMKPFGVKLQTPKAKAKPLVKTPLRPTPKRPLQVVEKPKPVPRVPKIIDRGPIDCCDSLVVETDMGFPCNFCEVSQNFALRREMIGHLQKEHPEELTPEQSNPDLTGLFPCATCGTVFHSKFIQRTHQKAHLKAKLDSCDKYYRYYLSFGQVKI